MLKNFKLGDKVEAVINAVVPKKIIKSIKEKEGGCDCGKRKEWLNNLT